MWQNFTVKNFRGFTNLSLRPLARVNLIAGKNNTGKTALLEAMHLYAYPLDVQVLDYGGKSRLYPFLEALPQVPFRYGVFPDHTGFWGGYTTPAALEIVRLCDPFVTTAYGDSGGQEQQMQLQ